MAEKNITMKRKTAQGWDVYYPKTKGGNIIQDGNNRLVTDAEKIVWNDALTKANKYTDERIESTYRIDLTKLDPKKAYPVSFDGYTEVLIRRKAHQDGDKNPNLSLYLHTMPSNWGGDAPFYEIIHRHTFAPEKTLVKKICSNMESSLTHVYLAGGYTYDIVNLLKHGKKAVVQEKDFTDPRGNKVVPVENLDSAMAQGHFRGTTECNITKDTSPEALLTNKEKADIDNALTDVKTNWQQKHRVTFHDGTAIGLDAKTDLNTVLGTGFYRGNQLVNAPTADAWHYLMVTKHTESYVMQVASVLDSGFNKDKNTLFIRHMINKVWTTWRAVSLREDWGLWSTNGGQDLLVHDKRALVGFNSNGEDKLHINYGNDFKNGVNVQGRLTVEGNDVIHKGWNVMRDASKTVLTQDDWNAVTETGLYLISDDAGKPKHSSTPPNCYPYGVLEVYRTGSNQALFQRYTSHQNAEVYVRSAWAEKSWSAWKRMVDVPYLDAGLARQVSKEGDTMTGSLLFDTNGGERRVYAKSTDIEAGYYFNKNALGLYDWKNKRSVFGYNQNVNQVNFEASKLTKFGVDIATVDDVNAGDAKQVSKTGDTMSGSLNFDKTLNGITWNMNTDYAKIYFKNDSDADANSYLGFETGDNGNEHFKWLTRNSTTTKEIMKLNQDGLDVQEGLIKSRGKEVALKEDVNGKLNRGGDTTTNINMISPKVVAGTADHGYIGFYPRTNDSAKRGAYIGYGSAGTNLLTISNEIGDVNINSQGKVLLNNKEVATKDEVSSLVAGVGQKFKITQDDGRPIEVSKNSFNDLQASGYYMGTSMNDAPLPNLNNWWFIEIMRHATGWVHQRATWFNTTTVETYERILNNNAWQPWKKTVTHTGWGQWRTNGGRDFLAYDKRAMVASSTTEGDRLTINYGNDFKNGVDVQGRLTNNDSPVLTQADSKNIMNYQSKVLDSNVNWDTLLESGFYIANQGGKGLNSPTGNFDYGVLEVIDTGGLGYLQRYTSHMGNMVSIRGKRKTDAKWSDWNTLATSDSVGADMNRRVSKTGDTMTGQLTVNTGGGTSTPILAQNSAGKMRILPYDGDSNYLQSGTAGDEAKNLRITGYNGKQMQRVNINAVDTVVEGSLVAGKNLSLNNGGEPNIYFHDHTSIFSRADRTGIYDRKENKTHFAVDNGAKAVQVENGYALKVVNGGVFEVGNQRMVGQDFLIHGKRAMVGFGDKMHLNYAKDMPNGVVSNGNFTVSDGRMYVEQNGKQAVVGTGLNDAYLHNSKSGKYLQLKDDGTFSYDAKKVALADEESHIKWSTFTNFQNGFKPLPEGHALFYGIDQFGFKHIRGLVTGGSTNAGVVIGKLPDFMKPIYWTAITATYDTNGSANYVPCAVHVSWGGDLICQNSRGASSFIIINGYYK